MNDSTQANLSAQLMQDLNSGTPNDNNFMSGFMPRPHIDNLDNPGPFHSSTYQTPVTPGQPALSDGHFSTFKVNISSTNSSSPSEDFIISSSDDHCSMPQLYNQTTPTPFYGALHHSGEEQDSDEDCFINPNDLGRSDIFPTDAGNSKVHKAITSCAVF